MSDTPKNGQCFALNIFTAETASEPEQITPGDFDPAWLLDLLIARLDLPDDMALARQLQVTPPIIKMIRNNKLAVSPSLLLRWVQATTGISVEEMLVLIQNKKNGSPGTLN